jgi:hypothetical protein
MWPGFQKSIVGWLLQKEGFTNYKVHSKKKEGPLEFGEPSSEDWTNITQESMKKQNYLKGRNLSLSYCASKKHTLDALMESGDL